MGRVRASERVRGEWGRRVEAEYRSAVIAQHLTLWLMQMGASPDLLERGLAVAQDELRHARASWEIYRAAGGVERPRLDREQLGLARRAGEPLEHDVLRACLDSFCLHETVAVPLFRGLRAAATVPAARRVLDGILVDEVRHRDFGWALLGALLDAAPPLREHASAALPALVAELFAAYAPVETRDERAIDPADARWGLMPGALYAEAVARSFTRDLVPRFARLEIDARCLAP